MDILIQQDGRIQTNYAIEPSRYEYRTVEAMPMDYVVARQVPEGSIPPRVPMIERRFRKLGKEGNITVWVEVR